MDDFEARIRQLEAECEALRRQLAQADALQEISRALTSTLDLQQVLTLILELAGRVIAYDSASVLLVTPDKTGVVVAACRGFLAGDVLIGRSFSFEEGNISAEVIANQQTLVVDDVQQHPGWSHERADLEGVTTIRSWIGTPLVVDGESIGMVTFDKHVPGFYSAQDAEAASAFAAQAALAVRNARLFEETHRRADELRQQKAEIELVYQTANTLSATLDTSTLLSQLLPMIVSAVEVTHGSVFLLDEEGRITHHALTRQDLSGVETKEVMRVVLERGLAGWVYKHAQPALVTEAATDIRWVRLQAPYEPVGSALCVPLSVRGAVRGILTLMHSDVAHFTARHQRTLMAIAQQAATTLENIYLYERERKRAEQLALLHRVSAAVSSSLDIKQVLQIATKRLVQSFAVDHCGVVLFDSGLEYGQLMAEYPPSAGAGSGFPLDGDLVEKELVTARRPVYISDVETDQRLGPAVQAALQSTGVISTLFVPLVVKGHIIGSFGLDARQSPRAFSPEEIELSQTIAAQIAIAVDNARLYEESVTRVEQEMEIARRIQHNLFPRNVPSLVGLQVIAMCYPARETGGDFYEFVTLSDRQLGIIVGDVSGKGLPSAMLMAAARSTARAVAYNRASPAQVLNEVNRLLCEDVPPGAFVAMSYALIDLERSRLAVSNGGQVLPLVLPAEGRAGYVELSGPRLPLGMWADLQYGEAWCDLHPGDTVLFFTDGLVEAHNVAGELFGFERLENLVNRHAGIPVGDLLGVVLESVKAFVQDAEQHDDITVVAVEIS